jgi:hypothetical protein
MEDTLGAGPRWLMEVNFSVYVQILYVIYRFILREFYLNTCFFFFCDGCRYVRLNYIEILFNVLDGFTK